MTRPGPVRRWDPLRPLDMLASLWSAAAVAPVTGSAATAYRTLFFTARRLVVGRRIGLRFDDIDLTLTVTEFDSQLDMRALTVGQLGNVQLAARDIDWGGTRFARATAVVHNAHLRPTVPPVLVAAPVELSLDIPAPALDDLFAWAAPRFRVHVGPDGVARLRLARRPRLGNLELDGRLDGSVLRLVPRGVRVGRRRWALPARTPSYSIRLPELPHGLQLTGISVAPHLVRVHGVVPEWQLPLPRGRLDELVGQLSAVGRPLTVPMNLARLLR
ncbi:hypothetical protein MMAG44476_25069 [Mycolicibacterium mageritense DSM 44476 = CIP 104973]|uniref:DUF2993 domain-containing protein n=1 Tax=Mycolicibacterium mageritense TaxID=53462 RepID=A0ABM7I3F7_MYCME|nr:hypothetical protein [Mycolicibacterium mageritense]BBX37427.1 hypothetical protein MMAGJ_67090 [Mycolicibacterium mageritense]CDO25905.1 hypothetical protein BN978_06452 [Mycolicibacterium mageritense DSM 44476 = CIP 104973]